jgi:hypothetical protein
MALEPVVVVGAAVVEEVAAMGVVDEAGDYTLVAMEVAGADKQVGAFRVRQRARPIRLMPTLWSPHL